MAARPVLVLSLLPEHLSDASRAFFHCAGSCFLPLFLRAPAAAHCARVSRSQRKERLIVVLLSLPLSFFIFSCIIS